MQYVPIEQTKRRKKESRKARIRLRLLSFAHYLLSLLGEASTYRALFIGLAGLGYSLPPELAESVTRTGLEAAALIGIILKDRIQVADSLRGSLEDKISEARGVLDSMLPPDLKVAFEDQEEETE